MQSDIPQLENGLFDGALLFDGRDYRVPEGIVAFSHHADRVAFAKDCGTYFRVEFLCKKPSTTYSFPIWDDARSPTMCESLEEAAVLINEFVWGL
jgi:hypothetical protein